MRLALVPSIFLMVLKLMHIPPGNCISTETVVRQQSFKNINNLQNKISKKNKVYLSVDFINNELKSDFEKVEKIFIFWNWGLNQCNFSLNGP